MALNSGSAILDAPSELGKRPLSVAMPAAHSTVADITAAVRRI
jgi:hypothetical protein